MEITKKELSLVIQILTTKMIEDDEQYDELIKLYLYLLKAYIKEDKILFIGIKD